jgi:hypothetical protein
LLIVRELKRAKARAPSNIVVSRLHRSNVLNRRACDPPPLPKFSLEKFISNRMLPALHEKDWF